MFITLLKICLYLFVIYEMCKLVNPMNEIENRKISVKLKNNTEEAFFYGNELPRYIRYVVINFLYHITLILVIFSFKLIPILSIVALEITGIVVRKKNLNQDITPVLIQIDAVISVIFLAFALFSL